MTTITKERVAEIIHAAGLEPCDYEEVFGSIKTGEIVAMARIALASLEAEPVGTFKKGPCGYHPSFHEDAVPLYTTPPASVANAYPLLEFVKEYIESWDLGMAGDSGLLASAKQAIVDSAIQQPAPVSVPDVPFDENSPYDVPCSMPSNLRELIAEEIGILFSDDDTQAVWSVCRRAAMLQGSQPVSNRDELLPGIKPAPELDFVAKNAESLPGNSPVIAWLRSDYNSDDKRDPNAPLFMLGSNDPSETWGVKYLPLSGNSPVIPDGYALVPIIPTEGMVINGFESEPDPHFSDEKEWAEYEALSGCRKAARLAELCWAAMIKASPKMKVKENF